MNQDTVKYFGRKMRHSEAVAIAVTHLTQYLDFQFSSSGLVLENPSYKLTMPNGSLLWFHQPPVAVLIVTAYVPSEILNILDFEIRARYSKGLRHLSVCQVSAEWCEVHIEFQGGVVGVEELLRWTNNKHKLTLPGA